MLADGLKALTPIAELSQAVQGLIYSTPCLFAAQEAIERALDGLTDASADLKDVLSNGWQLSYCNAILDANFTRASRP